jgi:hypothetical protein
MDLTFPWMGPLVPKIWAQQFFEVKVTPESSENKFLGPTEPRDSKSAIRFGPAGPELPGPTGGHPPEFWVL